MSEIVCLLFLGIFCSASLAHQDGGYYHDTAALPQQIWMKKLPDYRKLSKISMPGTHDTASFYGGDITQTQSLKIDQQLNAGIRFLDIRIVHEKNSFEIYHGIAYQHQNFDQVLKDVTNFLKNNPSEVLLMRISQEASERNNTRTFADTFNEYMKKYGSYFAYPKNNYDPLLCQIRGKILIYPTDYIPVLQEWGLNYRSAFDIQDYYNLTTNWDLYGKWEKILVHLKKADANYKENNKINMNYLSASGGSFPYFVASGHSSPGTGAPRLSTGLTTPGFKNRYPDFPRVSCFIGICTIAFEGTNTLVKDFLINNRSKLKYVGIVIADFPGAELIDAIIKINPLKFSPELGDVDKPCADKLTKNPS